MAYGFMSLYSARSTNVLGLVILLLAALFISVRGLTRAVEFTGGMMIQVHFPEALAAKSVEDMLVRAGLAGASVKDWNAYSSNFFIIFPPRDDILSARPAPRVVQQVIAALSTERRHVEVTDVEIITPTAGRRALIAGPASLSASYAAIMIYTAVRYG